MIGVFIRFFTLDVVSTHPAIYWGLGFVWLILLAATFGSLRCLDISRPAKIAWFLVVLILPIAGLTAYCFFCLTRGDWSFFRTIFAQPRVVKTVQKRS